jgi:hypothetical protein
MTKVPRVSRLSHMYLINAIVSSKGSVRTLLKPAVPCIASSEMTGVPIFGTCMCFRGHHARHPQCTKTESTLKKKANSIACHACHGSVTMDSSLTLHIGTCVHLADSCAKVTLRGQKRDNMTDLVLHWFEGSAAASVPVCPRC